MEAATGTNGTVLIVLAVIGLIGTLGTAYMATRNGKERQAKQVEAASTTAADATAESAASGFEVLAMQRVEELHDSYNKELARLTAENQRKDVENLRLTKRIQFLEERLDG